MGYISDMKPLTIEACCPSLESVERAVAGGASRIELCERLELGGVTPSEDLILKAVAAAGEIPVNVLIRPREGDFVYTAEETGRMLRSIAFCKSAAVAGIVIGALRPDGSVDMETMSQLIAEARPLPVTFHRAFDECRDLKASLEDVIALGCERLLTSGGCPDAYAGRFVLGELVAQAAGRIIVMPGCGITRSNLEEIASVSAALEFHGSRLF